VEDSNEQQVSRVGTFLRQLLLMKTLILWEKHSNF
jgi:hypothetical protein